MELSSSTLQTVYSQAACKAATTPLSLCVLPWFCGRGWTTSTLDYCPEFLGWNSDVLLWDTHGLLHQQPQSNNTMAILPFSSPSQILSPPNSSAFREPLNTEAFVWLWGHSHCGICDPITFQGEWTVKISLLSHTALCMSSLNLQNVWGGDQSGK